MHTFLNIAGVPVIMTHALFFFFLHKTLHSMATQNFKLSHSLFLSSVLFSWLRLLHRSSPVSSVNRARGELSRKSVPPCGFRGDPGILVLALRRQLRLTRSQYSGGGLEQNSSAQNPDQKTRRSDSNRRRFTVLNKQSTPENMDSKLKYRGAKQNKEI